MLCKLSLSNIKKSIKDYAIYFVTLVLGVCIFYIFNSVDSQTAMLSVEASKSEMIGLLTELLSYVSVFVSFILGFLIIYSCYKNIKYAFKVHIMQHDATRNATRKYRQGFLPAGLLFFFYYTTFVNQCKHNVFYQIVFDKFLIFPNSFCLQNHVV